MFALFSLLWSYALKCPKIIFILNILHNIRCIASKEHSMHCIACNCIVYGEEWKNGCFLWLSHWCRGRVRRLMWVKPLAVLVSRDTLEEIWGVVLNSPPSLPLKHDKQLLLQSNSAAYTSSPWGDCRRTVKAQKLYQHVWLELKWHFDDLSSSLPCLGSP